MANPEYVEMLRKDVKSWNEWRKENKSSIPDISGANLSGEDLSRANLYHTQVSRANLFATKLSRADLSRADLTGADFTKTDLFGADLFGAKLVGTNFTEAHLYGANLARANLYRTVFKDVTLKETNLSESRIAYAVFSSADVSGAKGLEKVIHQGPSTIGIDTLYLSEGKIPEVFLRGCGVPEDLIAYIPSLLGAGKAIQFYSCFISYSTQDEEFAKRLHSRMQQANLRVWFAPEDMKGGEKIYDQIESAIHLHDRLLLVLSESSMKSKWVLTEVRRARKTEQREGRRKLFPIRLMEYKNIEEWQQMDSTGEDIAEEIRQYYIPDFSNWKNHDAFETEFKKLLRDLKAEEN